MGSVRPHLSVKIHYGTQLQDSINRLDKTLDKQGANIERVESEVNEHETRITILENKGDGGK